MTEEARKRIKTQLEDWTMGKLQETIEQEKNQALKDFAEKLKTEFRTWVSPYPENYSSNEVIEEIVKEIDQLLETELGGK